VRPRTVFAVLGAALVAAALAAPMLPGSPLSAYSLIDLAGGGRAGGVWHAADAGPSAPPSEAVSPSPSPTRSGPLLAPAPVSVTTPGFWSWALLDTATGGVTGSANLAAPSDTASMSKAWVAADYLRRSAERNRPPNDEIMRRLSTMIRDSETKHTFEFHVANGNLASIRRMITLCGLTETTGVQNSWSLTRMSARDVARLGLCIADGRAAGPQWTSWLLGEMRSVRGPGRFGVIEVAPPQEQVAAKNGWLLREDQNWHIACLAVGQGWTLGVLARHAGTLGKDHGAGICRSVAEQLMAP
jgi:hypothetical protein